MNHQNYTGDVKALEARNRRLTMQLTTVSFALLLTLLIVMKLVGTEKTIIVPPTISKTFWVTNDNASNEYLEEMAGYTAWLILDVTPSSIDWKKQQLLKFAGPDVSGDLKRRMEVEATRLKRLNGSTYFELQQLIPDETKQSVMLTGRLRTQINGSNVSIVDKSYHVTFQQRGGRIHIKNFEEMEHAR